MARVTVEDCLDKVENRFALIMLASGRCRDLRHGDERIFPSSNKEPVHALREVAAGFVKFDERSKEKLRTSLREEAMID